MLSYRDFINYFGLSLYDERFQSFLTNTFSNITEYDILKGDYIISEDNGIELGFTNKDAVYDDDDNVVFEKGDPIFSHFIIYSKSSTIISDLPYGVTFTDRRSDIIAKAGNPTQTKDGY